MSSRRKSIIIVGAGPGVGIEVARRFGKAGYHVGLIRRDQTKLKQMIEQLRSEGRSVTGLAADAHDPTELSNAISALAKLAGGIDVLHHAVPGPLGAGYGPVTALDPQLLKAFMDARITSALVAAQASLPFLLASSGIILYTSGISDRTAYPGTAAIGVPQAALKLLVEHLRSELDPLGVQVAYLPLQHPPLYTDPEEEEKRTDLPAGFQMAERMTSADVAEAHYRSANERGVHELILGPEIRGLAATDTPENTAHHSGPA